jgi:hypothetical protein
MQYHSHTLLITHALHRELKAGDIKDTPYQYSTTLKTGIRSKSHFMLRKYNPWYGHIRDTQSVAPVNSFYSVIASHLFSSSSGVVVALDHRPLPFHDRLLHVKKRNRK